MEMMSLIPLFALLACASCAAQGISEFSGFPTSSPNREDKVVKTDAEWQKQLSPEQFRILRKKGTEAAFCSPLLDTHGVGVFHCAGCDLPLFSTDTKFESGTGWPSFFQPVSKNSIWLSEDRSYGMIRTEVLCARCDGHLGHVFKDGPLPTGLRFCMNGESLKFKKS
jgi:peptide-methionine (R)-S-oxide reductase